MRRVLPVAWSGVCFLPGLSLPGRKVVVVVRGEGEVLRGFSFLFHFLSSAVRREERGDVGAGRRRRRDGFREGGPCSRGEGAALLLLLFGRREAVVAGAEIRLEEGRRRRPLGFFFHEEVFLLVMFSSCLSFLLVFDGLQGQQVAPRRVHLEPEDVFLHRRQRAAPGFFFCHPPLLLLFPCKAGTSLGLCRRRRVFLGTHKTRRRPCAANG
mmetsp:Transcript_3390/g.11139  ORF Transcript_3390/g.11139 Transcript_3390/m.11139 type:complete len:211 (+) Transcript_3390:225-857(+)